MSAPSSLAAKAAETELRQRIEALEEELASARAKLTRVIAGEDDEVEKRDTTTTRYSDAGRVSRSSRISSVHGNPNRPPPQKRGYLFRWNDRSIGWQGTKWELRFIALEHGHLSYYRLHTDTAPRYVLSLRGCGVHDDGWKRNRRHRPSSGRKNVDPPLDEPGAYFFVFSIYNRAENIDVDESHEVAPLLRFSTPSMAEKNLWMQLLSETCDYCETDEFLEHEENRAAEIALQQQQQAHMVAAMPEAKEGTLPPLLFAPSQVKPRLNRRPSFTTKKLTPEKEHRPLRPEVGDIDKRDARSKKAYPPSKPMHRSAQPSYLSTDSKVPPNYRGWLNLGAVVLLVSNFRLLFETIQKHGFVLQDMLAQSGDVVGILDSSDPWKDFPFVYGLCLLALLVLASFGIEWLLSRKKIDETLGMLFHQINAHSSLVIPAALVWQAIDNPLLGSTLLFVSIITWMKLVSYTRANEDYRLSGPSDFGLSVVQNLDLEDEELMYPKNVTLSNLLYFWCAPTLTYQLAFPKYPVRRWWKITSLVVGIVLVGSLITFLTAQVVMPLLEGLIGELVATGGTYTVPILAKYWLKLSIASTYTWLLVFFLYFHLFLNLLAELLRFGDRVFYKDWWNSVELGSFWRLWNMPVGRRSGLVAGQYVGFVSPLLCLCCWQVHYWLIRHVYFPCIRHKLGRTGATFAVFLLSAILHEVAVSIPFHMIRPWSFLGMMLQLPLVGITKYLVRRQPGSSIGNFIFWLSFCVVGQPVAVLLYAVDYEFQKETGENLGAFQTNCRVSLWGHCLLGEG